MSALHRRGIRWLFGLALVLTSGFWHQARAQNASATNVVVLLAFEGRVEVSRASSIRWDPARTNQVLDPGDRIRTGADSRATLRMFDLSVMRLDQETVLELEAPPEPEPSIFVHLVRGVLYL